MNGLLMDDNSLTYPNAEILVPATEHQLLDGRRRDEPRPEGPYRRQFQECAGGSSPPEALKRVKTYEWGKEVIPGVTAQGTPGHTPGHSSFVIASGPESVYVQSRRHPRAVPVRPPSRLACVLRSRRRHGGRRPAARSTTCWRPDKMRVQGFHYPFPSLAHVEKVGQWLPGDSGNVESKYLMD